MSENIHTTPTHLELDYSNYRYADLMRKMGYNNQQIEEVLADVQTRTNWSIEDVESELLNGKKEDK